MSNIPTDFYKEFLVNSIEIQKREFKDYIEDIINSYYNINFNQLIFNQFQLYENLEQVEFINIEKFSKKLMNAYNSNLRKNLNNYLERIVDIYSSSVLDDFFQIIIELIVKQKTKDKPILFTLEEIYENFSLFGFKIIPINSLKTLTGALQWNAINPRLINYNFLSDYYNNISNNVSEEIKKNTWILLELTKIKMRESINKSSALFNIYRWG